MEKNKQEHGWWTFKFKIPWPQQSDASWNVDLFIGHKIIGPIITKYEKHFSFWRFHRRAARDDKGHQFSFLFFSTMEVAKQVINEIESNSFTKELLDLNIVETVIPGNTDSNDHPDIQELADPNWSPLVKKTWPHFINGVSQMWLTQINEIAQPNKGNTEDTNISSLLGSYNEINKVISSSWREEGRHAYLHHLNAIYGYEPLIIRDVSLRSF